VGVPSRKDDAAAWRDPYRAATPVAYVDGKTGDGDVAGCAGERPAEMTDTRTTSTQKIPLPTLTAMVERLRRQRLVLGADQVDARRGGARVRGGQHPAGRRGVLFVVAVVLAVLGIVGLITGLITIQEGTS